MTLPPIRLISQPYSDDRLGTVLLENLGSTKWTSLLAAVAFVKRSGTTHVKAKLRTFSSVADVRISVGVDQGGTSLEGVEDLWGALNGRGKLYLVNHVRQSGDRVHHSFHPKMYLFRNNAEALLLLGSGNLTQGGLYGNYEAGLCVELDLSVPEHKSLVDSTVHTLDHWTNPDWPQCVLATKDSILKAYLEGHLPREAALRSLRSASKQSTGTGDSATGTSIFKPAPVPPPPPKPEPSPVFESPVSSGLGPVQAPQPVPDKPPAPPVPADTQPGGNTSLYIEVIPHHNGEVFLSKSALVDNPGFFGHPFEGLTVARAENSSPYPMRVPDPIVEITVFGDEDEPIHKVINHPLNIVEYTRKSEIRITLPERMQDEIPEMSLLVMTRHGESNVEYTLDFFPPGSPTYGSLASKLTIPMPSGGRGSGRKYGWS